MFGLQSPPTHAGVARPRAPRAAHSTLPEHYCPVPQRLIHDLHDTVVAIGLYALVGRLYLLSHAPIPLSRADVTRYDPTLSDGAVKRALDRLLRAGWLAQDTAAKKHRYTPTWGTVRGQGVVWAVGQPRMGRPNHVSRHVLDLELFDTCMGKLTPHPTLAATVTRFVMTPALTLGDIGSYLLTAAGLPRVTPALAWLGAIQGTQTRPLPSRQHLLATISQRVLTLEETPCLPLTALTPAGVRQLGLIEPSPAAPTTAQPQPLFFMPLEQIGDLAAFLAANLIGQDANAAGLPSAAETLKTASAGTSSHMPWDDQDYQDENNPPPTPSSTTNGGGGMLFKHQQTTPRRTPEVPDTEATRLLRTLNVRPTALIRHAETAPDQITAAIRDADSRPYVNDRAAWVVSLLDDAVEHGHTISVPRGVMPSEWYATGGWSYEALAPSDSESQEQSLALTEPPAEEVQQPEEDVSAPVQPEDMTGHLRSELLVRVRDRALRSLIETLSVSEGPQAITVACAREHLSLISGPLYSHIHAILHSCGRALPIRLRAAQQPLASPASAAVDDPECPDWIAAERWQGLSPMLRAALRGSRLEDGALRCVTPYLDQVVATRYRADVADLVCSSPRA